MFVIGLTGPSGAGKTTALRVLEGLGGRVFDCDAIYHRMLASDGELLGRIEAAFPGSVQGYALDRKALGTRVFADPEGLQKLTNITQPIVAKRVLEEIRCLERPSSVTRVRTGDTFPPGGRLWPASPGGRPVAAPTTDNSPNCHSERSEESVPSSPIADCRLPIASFAVIDAIGLFESGLGEKCDLTVAVVADPELRVRRLTARDNISEDYARARIAAQKPAEWYAKQADLTLENNGSEDSFAKKCLDVFSKRLPHGQ